MCSGTKNRRTRRRSLASIGLRLTLWSAGVTFVAAALLCAALYAGLRYSLLHEVDAFLEGEVREFMVTVRLHPRDDRGLERDIRTELGSRLYHDLAFRLYDAGGRLLVSSEPNDPLAGAWQPPAGWMTSPPRVRFETVRVAALPYPYRVCSLRVTTAGGRACTAQAGYRLDHMVASLGMFRRICLAALGLALLLSLAGGRIIARRSLRPIQTLTETAQRIDGKRLSARVPLTGSGDELDLLAETINRMLDRIEHHVRQVRQFTADASHELRTPLAALRGAAEVALSRRRSADDLRQVVADSIEEYDRLARIAEDLLLLARADAGQDILRTERVRLDAAIADVVDLYRPLAEETGIELAFAERAEAWIEGDGGRLRQLVGNLIDNAIKYSPPGGQVSVTLHRTADGAELRIADRGPGIPSDLLPHVFDRFYRVDGARSRHRGGAGLGLAICHTIATAHGGRIRMESPPGNGVTVVVSLPA